MSEQEQLKDYAMTHKEGHLTSEYRFIKQITIAVLAILTVAEGIAWGMAYVKTAPGAGQFMAPFFSAALFKDGILWVFGLAVSIFTSGRVIPKGLDIFKGKQ